MLLAVDAGNTNLVFALVDETRTIRARWRIATDARRTADQYAVWLHQLLELEGYGRSDVSAVIIATVVPRALHNLEVLAEKYFHVTPMVAGSASARYGIALDVDEPGSVGADRAHSAHPGMGLHRDHRRLVDDDSAAARIDDGVGAAEVDREVGRGNLEQMAEGHGYVFLPLG